MRKSTSSDDALAVVGLEGDELGYLLGKSSWPPTHGLKSRRETVVERGPPGKADQHGKTFNVP